MRLLSVAHSRREAKLNFQLGEETRKMEDQFNKEQAKLMRKQQEEFLRLLEGESSRVKTPCCMLVYMIVYYCVCYSAVVYVTAVYLCTVVYRNVTYILYIHMLFNVCVLYSIMHSNYCMYCT
jgi:uncharacterized membrane protein